MKTSALVLAFALISGPALAENPMVGGAAMYETKNIVEIPVQEEIKPIEELFPPQENKKSSGSKLIIGALGGVFVIILLIAAVVGVWLGLP